ncbi:hypothetical protein [Isoptericola croceus]|uniref:hypothetical protein n=1 Tax=Isoptericola croceus TaxID=3031406 RepID=UPI0023F735CF|nr:hypothetical protein [Isoptericola croceus]
MKENAGTVTDSSSAPRAVLRADLITAVATDGVRVASMRKVWRSLAWWVPLNFARQPAIWVLVVGNGGLVWVADKMIVSRLLPGASVWPAIGWTGIVTALLYLVVTVLVAGLITRSRRWVLFSDDDRTAVIGARVRQEEEGVSVIVNNHVARHVGAGQGKRLRTRLSLGIRTFMDSHPDVALRFTAQNERLAHVYLSDLAGALPTSDGWNHELEGRRAVVTRAS